VSARHAEGGRQDLVDGATAVVLSGHVQGYGPALDQRGNRQLSLVAAVRRVLCLVGLGPASDAKDIEIAVLRIS
jgi:hypothetical protein